MSNVPHCSSADALQSLLPRAPIVVAFASWMSGFPAHLSTECAKVKADILCLTVQQNALEQITGDQVEHNDVAVFANQKLVELVSRRGVRIPKKHQGLMLVADLLTEGRLQQSEASFRRAVLEAVQAAAKQAGGKKKRSGQGTSSSSKGRRDPYEILGVPHGASAKELKQARARQLENLHPDRLHQYQLHPALIQRANELTAEINWAYEELKKKAAA
jgi:DnaJ-domain-containing protein 1